jgi:hypothetical protein
MKDEDMNPAFMNEKCWDWLDVVDRETEGNWDF